MINEELEKLIAGYFNRLPRKSIAPNDKLAIWLKIKSRIAIPEREPIWNFAFLMRRSLVMAAVIIVLAAVSVVHSAAKANPGETLYSVKIATEQVEKVLATNDEAKVKVGVKHARRRLAEIQVLVEGKKESAIVTQTLEALKNTTQEIVAASESKPELASQAVDLATEEEKVLSSVENHPDQEVKDALQSAITVSKESINKLSGKESHGKNTVDGAQTTATSTDGTVARPATHGIKKQDGQIESTIQLNGVTSGDGATSKPEEPEILPEPTTPF